MSTTDETTETTMPRIIGQVKWFNNKAGYGFITVSSGEHKGKDIFIHYSGIRVVNSQYKYLVQGEYVEFGLVKSTSPTHEFQAVDISGINGGSLMCETRSVNASQYPVERRPNVQPRRPVGAGGNRSNNSRREEASEHVEQSGDYTVVQRRRGPNPRSKKPVAAAAPAGEAATASI